MSVKAIRLEKPAWSASSSRNGDLNCGLMFKVREEGGCDGDDGWRGHWQRPSEPIQIFLPGKTVNDIPREMAPGLRIPFAQVADYTKRYEALFSVADLAQRRVDRLPEGAPVEASGTDNVASQVGCIVYIVTIFHKSCVATHPP
jgi:hypothetical protein